MSVMSKSGKSATKSATGGLGVDRSQMLLKFLVERYIRDGQPVGSRTLAKDSGLDLSPATIRNVMADLEDLGLVRSPHTSAGRIPTAKGYRVFVDSLLTIKPMHSQEVESIRQKLSLSSSTESLITHASDMLSRISHLAGVVTIPRRERVRLQHIEFLPLSARRVLAILVVNGQEVQNRIIDADRCACPVVRGRELSEQRICRPRTTGHAHPLVGQHATGPRCHAAPDAGCHAYRRSNPRPTTR